MTNTVLLMPEGYIRKIILDEHVFVFSWIRGKTAWVLQLMYRRKKPTADPDISSLLTVQDNILQMVWSFTFHMVNSLSTIIPPVTLPFSRPRI